MSLTNCRSDEESGRGTIIRACPRSHQYFKSEHQANARKRMGQKFLIFAPATARRRIFSFRYLSIQSNANELVRTWMPTDDSYLCICHVQFLNYQILSWLHGGNVNNKPSIQRQKPALGRCRALSRQTIALDRMHHYSCRLQQRLAPKIELVSEWIV